mmetsp:Transcript_56114/g.162630  ORF Transcript_56114/g.162630 Transcript_56114/m.162630 type:complete len:92 (+) Transcript_56114:602-877(+)
MPAEAVRPPTVAADGNPRGRLGVPVRSLARPGFRCVGASVLKHYTLDGMLRSMPRGNPCESMRDSQSFSVALWAALRRCRSRVRMSWAGCR